MEAVVVLAWAAASNAVWATALAIVAWIAGKWAARPAVTHGLWLLVTLKLLTPPFWFPTFPIAFNESSASAITSPPPELRRELPADGLIPVTTNPPPAAVERSATPIKAASVESHLANEPPVAVSAW